MTTAGGEAWVMPNSRKRRSRNQSAREEDGSDAEVPGRMRDLLAAGVSDFAATGVLICEFGLRVARISEEMVAVVAPYLASELALGAGRGT